MCRKTTSIYNCNHRETGLERCSAKRQCDRQSCCVRFFSFGPVCQVSQHEVIQQAPCPKCMGRFLSTWQQGQHDIQRDWARQDRPLADRDGLHQQASQGQARVAASKLAAGQRPPQPPASPAPAGPPLQERGRELPPRSSANPARNRSLTRRPATRLPSEGSRTRSYASDNNRTTAQRNPSKSRHTSDARHRTRTHGSSSSSSSSEQRHRGSSRLAVPDRHGKKAKSSSSSSQPRRRESRRHEHTSSSRKHGPERGESSSVVRGHASVSTLRSSDIEADQVSIPAHDEYAHYRV